MIQRKSWDLSEYSYKGSEDQGNLYIGKPSAGSPLKNAGNQPSPSPTGPFSPGML